VTSTIVLSAGEASGDLNGAFLVRELRKLRPDLRFWGAGGSRMREAGVEIAVDMAGGGTIGVFETVKSAPAVCARYFAMRRRLLRQPPDLFVPIDFGAFNVRLAQVLRKRGVSVVYYYPPSSWRRRPRNAAKLMACGGKVITPFPWSAEYLSAAGLDARYVGHPLVDIARPAVDRSTFLREIGLDESLPVIGLLPGSRGHELKEHIPPMIGCAGIMDRELGGAQFIVAAAPGSGKWIRDRIDPMVRVIEGRAYDCMAASDLLISKSGTATLEAAVIGTPMVIVYRGTAIMRLEYRLRKSELEDFIGMPNIVLDRGACPELLNEDVTAEKLADVALSILGDKGTLSAMRNSLREVKRRLGECGAVERAARALLEMGDLT